MARLSLMHGTLDLVVLGLLAGGVMHGYGIASLVHQRTGGELSVEDAALYQALHRLERQGLIEAEWGPSENNRRAKYYMLTRAGRKQLGEETAQWNRIALAIARALEA